MCAFVDRSGGSRKTNAEQMAKRVNIIFANNNPAEIPADYIININDA